MVVIKYCLAIFFIACSINIHAQKIIIGDVTENLRDLSASINVRYDDNGDPCGLLKIAFVNKNAKFAGNIYGDVINNTNEYWIYIKQGSSQIIVFTPESDSIVICFKDYGIEKIQSKVTYNIILKQQAKQLKPLEKNEHSDFEECKRKAAEGDPDAILQLGKCYLYGTGVAENTTEAARCFERAAKSGNVEAIFQVGNCYLYGQGYPKNTSIAISYYLQAAEKGYAPAQYKVGLCYEKGDGLEKNEENAQKYFNLAAQNGYKKAIEKLNKK